MPGGVETMIVESIRMGSRTPTIGSKMLDCDALILADQEIPVGAVAEVVAGCAFDATALTWFYLHSNQDVTLTFTLAVGTKTVALKAGKPWKWDRVYVASFPNPFRYNSLSCTAANASGAVATLKIRGGLTASTISGPIPNASPFWWGEGDATLNDMRASALWQIAAGLNTVTVGAGGYVTSVVALGDDGHLDNVCLDRINQLRTDDVALAAYNDKFGTALMEIPFTLQDTPGAGGATWDGVMGDATSIRSTSLNQLGGADPPDIDPAADDFVACYHTFIQDMMDEHEITDLRDLVPHLTQWGGYVFTDLVIDASTNTDVTSAKYTFVAGDIDKTLTITSGSNFAPGAYTIVSVPSAGKARLSAAVGTVGSTGGVGSFAGGTVQPMWFRCPNYGLVGGAGKFYDNAMLRFEQLVKYIRPVHVSLDMEAWWTSALADYNALTLLGLSDALSKCSRCLTRAGFEAGKDAFATALIDKVHEYVPAATVTFYDVYSGLANFNATEIYGPGIWFNFGDASGSGITVGSPSLYDLSFEADPAAAIATFVAAGATHYTSAPYNEAPQVNIAQGIWWGLQPSALLGSYVWLTHCNHAWPTPGGTSADEYLTDEDFEALCYALGRLGAIGCYLYPGYHGDPDCENDKAMNRLFPVGIAAFAAAKASL